MSDIGAVRRYLTPWRTLDGQVRYYVDDWMDRIMPCLTAYLVEHDEAPTIPELEKAKVWYDESADVHVDHVSDPGTRDFISREMSKEFTEDGTLLSLVGMIQNSDPVYVSRESMTGIPSHDGARSNIEAIRRYLKPYRAFDDSVRYYVNNWQEKAMPAVERYLAEDADEVTRRQFWSGKAYFDDRAELHVTGIQDEILVEIIVRHTIHNHYLWGRDDATNDIVLDFLGE